MAEPYFDNVTLLAKFDGAATDLTGRHTITLADGAAVSSAQKKFGSSSLLVGATPTGAARATVSGGTVADWQFGGEPFTVECWVYYTDVTSTQTLIINQGGSGGTQYGWSIRRSVVNDLVFQYSPNGTGVANIASPNFLPSVNTWYHIAVDRNSAKLVRVYVDGVIVASAAVAAAFFASSQALLIGNDFNLTRSFPGYIDDVRITKGVARYAGAFTPPTASFDAESSMGGDWIKLPPHRSNRRRR